MAGLPPIWGGFGADRDPVALIDMGVATAVIGLFDHLSLVRALASVGSGEPGRDDARA